MANVVQPTHNSGFATSGAHHPAGVHDAHSSGLGHNGHADAYDGRHSGGLASHLDGHAQNPRATIFLRPIADPGALGWSGFAIGTFIVSSWLTRWWGSAETSPFVFFGFVSIFGGVAQFMAGMFSFHARDALGTVFFSLWGSFYMAFGVLSLLYAYGIGAPSIFGPRGTFGDNDEFGIWWASLLIITLPCAIASIRRDVVQAATLWTTVLGTVLLTAGFFKGNRSVIKSGAYIMLIASALAYVRASLFIIEDNIAPSNKRGGNVRTAAIPLGGKADSTSNGVDDGAGEAGVKRGGHAIRHAEHAAFHDDKTVSRPVA